MSFHNQQILPAIRNMKQFDAFLESPFLYGVILDIHLGQLKGVVNEAKKHGKLLMVHVDLIHGIKHDEFISHRQSETKENIRDPASVSLGYERHGEKHGIRRKA